VVSDDRRFDLVPHAISTGTDLLSINLVAGWTPAPSRPRSSSPWPAASQPGYYAATRRWEPSRGVRRSARRR
jgi:hypothetical protein